MKILRNLTDCNNKLSLAFSMRAGYRIKLDGDVEAEVTSPEGEVYHVDGQSCTCPDFLNRGGSYTKPDGTTACKHIFWSAQVTPCPNCNGIMTLNVEAGWKVFACHSCPTMVAFQAVRLDRLKAREQRDELATIQKAEEASAAVFA